MDNIVLLAAIVFFVLAIKSHVLTKTHVKVDIKKPWYDRLFSGDRPRKDNLTDDGLAYRRRSNIYAIVGFILIGTYAFLRSSYYQ